MLANPFTPERIEAEYQRLGYKLGWRFLYSPQRVLNSAEFAVLGLNPGGASLEPDHPNWSAENGSAYVVERWRDRYGRVCPPGQSPLQVQVQRMFQLAGVEPANALAGNFVPFRSPNWKSLPSRPEALAFGEELWRWVFSAAPVRTVIVIGVNDGRLPERIGSILGMRPELSVQVGWGNFRAAMYKGSDGRTMIALPHLSRYQVFGRGAFDLEFRKLISSSH